ncbi:MAG: NADase-type glycan-binding domain-containing protein [Dysgonomonas sp.]
MKKIIIYALIQLVILPTIANGDPTDKHSALIGSSNLTPMKIADVQVLSEKLYIRPGKYSQVAVKYVLWNKSDKDYIDIDYGFPIDYEGGGEKYVNSGLTPDYYSESSMAIGWQDNYIKEISFYLDGKALSSKASTEAVPTKDQLSENQLNSDLIPNRKDFPPGKEGQISYEEAYKEGLEAYAFYNNCGSTYRRWFYTQISIKKGEIVTLEVRYAIRNSSITSTYGSKKADYTSNNELLYDLSPASNWGNGTAHDFQVEIDASDIAITPDYFENSRYPNIQVEGLPFTRNGNIYSYQANSFKFKEAKPIQMKYLLINSLDIAEYLSQRIPDNEYRISVTSEQSTYPAKNLFDLDFASAWVAAKKGIGSKIIIDFKKPTLIYGFAMINGYHKNKSTYLENNRIKSIAVHIEGEKSWGDNFESSPINDVINLKASNYQPISFDNMRQHPDMYYYDIARHEQYKATRIELEITDIYPGTKYDDTCLSEIILFKGK